jgi:hypothetical protein
MKVTLDIPDEYVKEFLDELKMTLKMINTDMEEKK